jgi:hypothetical protein
MLHVGDVITFVLFCMHALQPSPDVPSFSDKLIFCRLSDA